MSGDSPVRVVQTGKYIIYIFPDLILFIPRVIIRFWIEIILPWFNIVWSFKAVARFPIRTRAIESTISWRTDFRFPNWILLMWKIIFVTIGIEKLTSVFIYSKILKWLLKNISRSFLTRIWSMLCEAYHDRRYNICSISYEAIWLSLYDRGHIILYNIIWPIEHGPYNMGHIIWVYICWN